MTIEIDFMIYFIITKTNFIPEEILYEKAKDHLITTKKPLKSGAFLVARSGVEPETSGL